MVATFCWSLFEMPRRAQHHRESSGVAWGAWPMNLLQDWLVGSSKSYDDRAPPFVRRNCPSGRVSGPSRRPSSDSPSSGNATRRAVSTDQGGRTIIVSALRTRRANPGGDPSAKRPMRLLNSREGAGRDAAFRRNTSRRWQPFAFMTQALLYFRSVQRFGKIAFWGYAYFERPPRFKWNSCSPSNRPD